MLQRLQIQTKLNYKQKTCEQNDQLPAVIRNKPAKHTHPHLKNYYLKQLYISKKPGTELPQRCAGEHVCPAHRCRSAVPFFFSRLARTHYFVRWITNTPIHQYNSTPAHQYTCTPLQRYNGTSVHQYYNARIQQYTGTPVCQYNNTAVHWYTNTPIHRYTGTPVHWYTYTPTHYIGTPVHRHTDTQIHRYT